MFGIIINCYTALSLPLYSHFIAEEPAPVHPSKFIFALLSILFVATVNDKAVIYPAPCFAIKPEPLRYADPGLPVSQKSALACRVSQEDRCTVHRVPGPTGRRVVSSRRLFAVGDSPRHDSCSSEHDMSWPGRSLFQLVFLTSCAHYIQSRDTEPDRESTVKRLLLSRGGLRRFSCQVPIVSAVVMDALCTKVSG